MPHKRLITFLTTSFFQRILLFFGGVFFIFLGSLSAYANPLNKETPPQNTLRHGAYAHWLENTLETPPLSEREKLKQKNVVKQAQSLATKQGEQVLWIVDKKIGIGIQTPKEILDIRSSDKASLKISSPNNPKILLENSEISLSESEFFLQVGDTKMIITPAGINTKGEVTIAQKNVVLAQQRCPGGKAISGTDEEGNIICSDQTTSQIPYCNINTITLAKKIRVLNRCTLAPKNPSQKCILNFSSSKKLNGKCYFDGLTSEDPEEIEYLDFSGDKTIGDFIFYPE